LHFPFFGAGIIARADDVELRAGFADSNFFFRKYANYLRPAFSRARILLWANPAAKMPDRISAARGAAARIGSAPREGGRRADRISAAAKRTGARERTVTSPKKRRIETDPYRVHAEGTGAVNGA